MRGCEALALLALPANCKSKEPLTAGPLPGCFRASDGQLLRVFQNWRITRLGRGGMIVRIFGCVLFILGFLISLSIVGAIFGVPMMGLGVLLMIFGGADARLLSTTWFPLTQPPLLFLGKCNLTSLMPSPGHRGGSRFRNRETDKRCLLQTEAMIVNRDLGQSTLIRMIRRSGKHWSNTTPIFLAS